MSFNLLSILVLAFMLTGCGGGWVYKDDVYNPSKVWQEFEYQGDQSYKDKIIELRSALSSVWLDRTNHGQYTKASFQSIDQIVELMAPFDGVIVDSKCTKSRGVVLLLHGLYDSPYIMKDMGHYFNTKCYQTRFLLLPGHGTVPGDLRHISYLDWVKAVQFAVNKSKQKFAVENIIIAGFSTGGGLALNHALEHPADVRALFLFAPLVNLSAMKVIGAYAVEAVAEYVQKKPEQDSFKYESVTANSAIQAHKLTQSIESGFSDQKLAMPIFLAQSNSDHTLASRDIIDLYSRELSGPRSSFILYSPIAIAGFDFKSCDDPARFDIELGTGIACNSSFDYLSTRNRVQIDDYSHMSLTMSSSDPHYGVNGHYRYCLHYSDDLACKSNDLSKVCYGERAIFGASPVTESCKQNNKPVIRLTSNPRFEHLKTQLDYFLQANGL